MGAPLRSEWNGGAGVPLQSCGVSGGEVGWESGWWGDVWVLCPVHLCCPETVSQPAVGRGCHSNPVTLPRVGPSHSHPRIKASLPFTGALCSFPRFPGDLLSHPSSLFLLSQQLLHPGPAVLEGKVTDLQPRWWPSGRSWLLTLVGAGPGLSSLHPVAQGDPQGPVGAGILWFFQSPPAGCLPKPEEPHARCAASFPF